MFNAADLAEAALRLFTRVLAGTSGPEPAAAAVTLWLGLHGLADQRTSVRRSAQFPALAPRLIASLTHV